MSGQDKYRKYQSVLEPLMAVISADFDSSPKDYTAIDTALRKITESIHYVSDKLPHSQYKKNLKPFWNKNLSALKFRKVNSYRDWVLAGRPRNSDHPLYIRYKTDKKIFHSAVKRLSKEYEENEILEVIKSAEINRNSFWRLIKTARKSQISGINAIKRSDEVVVHEIKEVLKVWSEHFKKIGTPKVSENFDEEHFIAVSEAVAGYNNLNDNDNFLDNPCLMMRCRKQSGRSTLVRPQVLMKLWRSI